MKITWLGESGFILDDGQKAILLDPYWSDALGERREDRHRLLPIKQEWLERSYDLVLFTHAHIDHTDPQTIQMLLARQPRLMFAGPPSSHDVLKDCPCFFELFEGAKVTLGAFVIRALPAIHSDRYALGYEIVYEGKTLYFSGDTALLCDLAARVPHQPDAAFLCFNAGVGKNMNAQDATVLAERIDAKLVIPFHYGILPGGVTPEEFEALLIKQKRPHFTPAYGETFEV